MCLNRLPKLRRELLQIEPLEDVLDDTAPSPPDILETQEQMAFLHAELERMPEKYRLVLSLRYLEHMSYEEIATALNAPLGTVKTHIHRARGLLVDRVRQWEGKTPRVSPQETRGATRADPSGKDSKQAGETSKGLDRSVSYALS